jgi:glyoxylase-like metal-dependent hydrolase (beta-lactamase superfamily II)
MSAVKCPPSLQLLERGWLSSNTLIARGRDTVLIDSGYHTHSAFMLLTLQASLGGSPVDRLFNTHLHSDHCGGNAALCDAYPGLQVSIPGSAASRVAQWDHASQLYDAVGQHCPPFPFQVTHAGGDTVEFGDLDWRVLASPGHDNDSVMFFNEDTRTLISADALWENGFGVLFPMLDGHDALTDQLATLDLIESLGAVCVIPGHGSVFGEINRSLDAARARLESFVQKPERHIQNALRVLMKFNLLEWQSVAWPDYRQRFAQFPAVQKITAEHFPGTDGLQLADQVAQALVKAGVAEFSGTLLRNR